jgi:hypothetical protein
MPEQQMPRSEFMYTTWVDKNVKQKAEAELLWEKLLTKQSVNGLNVRYYREQYTDIETPNDSDMGASIDEFLRSPGYRAPGGTFPHTTYGEPLAYNAGLYQLGLEIDVPDEAQKYVEMENVILKSQRKLANSFASRVNTILGNKLTDTWATASSLIQHVTISAASEWSVGPLSASVRPIKDVLAARELIEDVPGYNYKPTGIAVSVQSHFDLLLWMAEKGYEYKEKLNLDSGATTVSRIEGLTLVATNQVKRDYAVVGDFKAAGVLFESEPTNVKQYYTPADRSSHVQISRTFTYALTDPKAICTILNTVA